MKYKVFICLLLVAVVVAGSGCVEDTKTGYKTCGEYEQGLRITREDVREFVAKGCCTYMSGNSMYLSFNCACDCEELGLLYFGSADILFEPNTCICIGEDKIPKQIYGE